MTTKCAGYIKVVFFDQSSGEEVTLGGVGLLTEQVKTNAWANVRLFYGKSSFQMSLMNSRGDTVDEKTVDVITCEKLLGKSITTLIIEGRAKLASELASHRKV